MNKQNMDIIFEQSRYIAHEIRNHLSICELYTEIIKKHSDNGKTKNESIDNALKCIKKSLKIMGNSLLDLKSLNNLKVEDHDLKTVINEGVNLSKIYSHDKDIEITAHINETALIKIDENKFLACIVNIIKNAIEAIENKGKIKVITRIKNNIASIKILNNGKPISKENQNQIFKEGYTTKLTGSGLGLYICRNNLAMQNAELRLNKSDKEETEFEIKLPVISIYN